MYELTDIVNEGWKAYQDFQGSNPLLGSMLTAELTFPFGDVASQLIKNRKVNWRQVRYTAALSPFYGAGLHALIESGELIGKTISENSLLKSMLGPNLWGNLYNTFFFVNNTVGEKNNYSLKKLVKNYKDIFSVKDDEKGVSIWENFRNNYINNIPKKEYLNSVIGTLTAWNVFQYMNYEYVQESMRTPTSLVAGVLWISLLSLWSLKGRRKLVYGGINKF